MSCGGMVFTKFFKETLLRGSGKMEYTKTNITYHNCGKDGSPMTAYMKMTLQERQAE